MQETPIPVTAPVRVARDTYLIPNLAPGGPDAYVPVNSMVILGAEPIVVDTGAPVHREHCLRPRAAGVGARAVGSAEWRGWRPSCCTCVTPTW